MDTEGRDPVVSRNQVRDLGQIEVSLPDNNLGDLLAKPARTCPQASPCTSAQSVPRDVPACEYPVSSDRISSLTLDSNEHPVTGQSASYFQKYFWIGWAWRNAKVQGNMRPTRVRNGYAIVGFCRGQGLGKISKTFVIENTRIESMF